MARPYNPRMDLFDSARAAHRQDARPLAARMRPRTLDEYAGQAHFLAPGKLLRRMLQADRLGSLIFTGPPGCGKTALAHVVAQSTKSEFKPLNAVSATTKDVREILAAARERLEDHGARTILFLDEIHRFNKAQQDTLLPDVEEGVVTLIGATTQNPFFSIVTPLLSRSQVFRFEPLSEADIATVVRRALADPERGLGKLNVTVTPGAMQFWATTADGDARRALTALEIAVKSAPPELAKSAAGIVIDLELARESIQSKVQGYDGAGDAHYDLASALIKSIRGGDPHAGLYWLARFLEAGEDPRFVARRLAILASEDIGNADPQALVLAHAAWDSVERVGLPECRLALAQAVTYLATAPKSNASTLAIDAAQKDAREGRTLEVPASLRDSHYKGAASQGAGVGYVYSHEGEGGWVDQDYAPVRLDYYKPTDRGFEAVIRARMAEIELRRGAGRLPPPA